MVGVATRRNQDVLRPRPAIAGHPWLRARATAVVLASERRSRSIIARSLGGNEKDSSNGVTQRTSALPRDTPLVTLSPRTKKENRLEFLRSDEIDALDVESTRTIKPRKLATTNRADCFSRSTLYRVQQQRFFIRGGSFGRRQPTKGQLGIFRASPAIRWFTGVGKSWTMVCMMGNDLD